MCCLFYRHERDLDHTYHFEIRSRHFVKWAKILSTFNCHMARKAQDGVSIMRLQVLSSFLFHSELWGWPHLCAELDGNGFFLEFTSTGNFLVKKSENRVFRKVPILACFLVKNPGGKKKGVKRRILCVKRILHSFPHFLSVGAVILHEVQQWFLTKKHTKMGTFLNTLFSLFLTKKFPQLVNLKKKPFLSNSAHK